jgi:hypothetical protein
MSCRNAAPPARRDRPSSHSVVIRAWLRCAIGRVRGRPSAFLVENSSTPQDHHALRARFGAAAAVKMRKFVIAEVTDFEASNFRVRVSIL